MNLFVRVITVNCSRFLVDPPRVSSIFLHLAILVSSNQVHLFPIGTVCMPDTPIIGLDHIITTHIFVCLLDFFKYIGVCNK